MCVWAVNINEWGVCSGRKQRLKKWKEINLFAFTRQTTERFNNSWTRLGTAINEFNARLLNGDEAILAIVANVE